MSKPRSMTMIIGMECFGRPSEMVKDLDGSKRRQVDRYLWKMMGQSEACFQLLRPARLVVPLLGPRPPSCIESAMSQQLWASMNQLID